MNKEEILKKFNWAQENIDRLIINQNEILAAESRTLECLQQEKIRLDVLKDLIIELL